MAKLRTAANYPKIEAGVKLTHMPSDTHNSPLLCVTWPTTGDGREKVEMKKIVRTGGTEFQRETRPTKLPTPLFQRTGFSHKHTGFASRDEEILRKR